MQQRAAIGLKRRHPHSRLLVLPGDDALNDLVNAIDPVSLAGALNRWIIANSDLLPKTLAISAVETGHGRIEYRELRVCGFDLDTALFAGARQLLGSTAPFSRLDLARNRSGHSTNRFCSLVSDRARSLVGGERKPLAQGRHRLTRGPRRALQASRGDEPRPVAQRTAGPQMP